MQQGPSDRFPALGEDFRSLFDSEIQQVSRGEFSGHANELHAPKPKTIEKGRKSENVAPRG